LELFSCGRPKNCCICPFLINDAWVFKNKRPSWRRLWQFHVAGAGGFAVWLVVTNTLPLVGVHYLIASVAGSAASMLFSILTNFLWIWRKRDDSQSSARGASVAVGTEQQG
jgi:putative flippase GtrA